MPCNLFSSNRWKQISLRLLSGALHQGSNHSATVAGKNINTVECGSSDKGRLRKQGPRENRKDQRETSLSETSSADSFVEEDLDVNSCALPSLYIG